MREIVRQRRSRKRSAAITLVLAGTLQGCSDPPEHRDVYANLDSCRRDWHNTQLCEPVRDNRYASSYFYGPSYFGSTFPSGTPRPSANAMAAVPAARGSAAASGSSSRSWFSGSPGSSSSSSVSRGGFGSSASSSGG